MNRKMLLRIILILTLVAGMPIYAIAAQIVSTYCNAYVTVPSGSDYKKATVFVRTVLTTSSGALVTNLKKNNFMIVESKGMYSNPYPTLSVSGGDNGVYEIGLKGTWDKYDSYRILILIKNGANNGTIQISISAIAPKSY